MNTKNILISGGTGLLGNSLRNVLENNGYQIAVLSRSKQVDGMKSFHWDPMKDEMDPEAIEYADAVIHLAGENISAGKWTNSQKKKIIESRVNSSTLLYKCIKSAKDKPKKFISASAVGFYGSVSKEQVFKESDPPGDDFLAETVIQWEKSVDPIEKLGIKVNKLRIGVVLSPDGGALQKMTGPVKMGAGAPLGSGKQWMPWISINDLSRMFVHVLENDFPGEVFNAVSPQHINNKDFMKELAKALGKAFFLPNVPSFALKLALGEMATIVLEGSRVSSKKILDSGFEFSDPNLSAYLSKIL